MQVQKFSTAKLVTWLLVLSIIFVAISYGTGPKAFVSPEVSFTDTSASGLSIVPASCASDPSWFHGNLETSPDGLGYSSQTGEVEYGFTKVISGVTVSTCVTNVTGNKYFVPAYTQAEVNAFKAARIPNLQVW